MFPKDAEGLVGLIVLEPMADHLFIGNIAVGPRCQGRGLGSELLAFAEGRACAAGFRGARLYANGRLGPFGRKGWLSVSLTPSSWR